MGTNKAEIKGYNLSTDYKKLWDLIQNGNRVPAWIVYSKEFDPNDPIYDLVEVKLAYMSDRYSIGVRGHCYDTFDSDFESFEMNCKRLELRFVEQFNNQSEIDELTKEVERLTNLLKFSHKIYLTTH